MKKKLKINKRAKWKLTEPPVKLQLDYYKALMAYTSEIAKIFKAEVFPAVEKAASKGLLDAEKTPIDIAFESFMTKATELSRAKINKAAKKMISGVEVFQRNLFVSNIKKSFGVDIEAIVNQKNVATEIKAAEKWNFDLIKSIKESYRDRGRVIVDEGLRTGRAQKDMVKDLLNLGGFDERYKGTEQRRAKLIVRDQSQKFAKSIDLARQKNIGVKHFIWVNVADDRVRDNHNLWGGHRFAYADPPDGFLPGDDVQCRCHAKPDLEDLLSALENL